MTTKVLTLAPDAFEIVVRGRLEQKDYEHLVPLVEKRIEQHGAVSLLVHVEEMRGWSPEALWTDLKFDVKHYSHVRRLGLVADSQSKRWLATLSKPFTRAEVEIFTNNNVEEARDWVRGGSAPTSALSGTG
jgi:hypothetical protein